MKMKTKKIITVIIALAILSLTILPVSGFSEPAVPATANATAPTLSAAQASGVQYAGINIVQAYAAVKIKPWKIWECNKHTDTGKNGKECICGVHKWVEDKLGLGKYK